MHRRALIIAILAAGILLLTALILLVSNKSSEEIGPRPTAPTVTPTQTPGESEEEEKVERQVVAYNNQPLIKALPYANNFWSLEYRGSSHHILRVFAYVYYLPGHDPQAKIKQQKPYILDFIKKTGQPKGTYSVKYKAILPQTD